MINRIEHLGIAVADLVKSEELFEKLLDRKPYKSEEVESEEVTTLFFRVGETKVELLEGQSENSAISKYLEKRKEGIHHIALGVTHLEYEINRLKQQGFEFINEVPKLGADGKRIVFIHPRSANGILVELCEDISKSPQDEEE